MAKSHARDRANSSQTAVATQTECGEVGKRKQLLRASVLGQLEPNLVRFLYSANAECRREKHATSSGWREHGQKKGGGTEKVALSRANGCA